MNEWITRFDGVVMKTHAVRYLSLATLCVIGCFASVAFGDLYTQLSDFDQSSFGGATVNNVKQVSTPSNAGVAYSNQWDMGGGPVDGAKLRVVAATRLDSGQVIGAPFNFDVLAGSTDERLVAVFAGEATVNFDGTTATATFAPTGGNPGGVLGIFHANNTDDGFFLVSDPGSWGVTMDNEVARFTLKPQEATFQGNSDAAFVLKTPDQTNNLSVNSVDPNAVIDGTLLFRDVLDPIFQNLTSDTNGNPIVDEGLIVDVDEEVDTTLSPTDLSSGLDPLTELNRIADLLGQPMNIGGNAFATNLGNGSATDFLSTVNFPDDFGASGDLTTNLDLTLFPAQQTAIPEPASIAMWTLLFGIAAGYFWRSRRKYR